MALTTRVSAQETCPPARTALVLAGGGAKGFAHIGLIQILDSIGVKPDLIVGSSIGAIVGALYASGYTGREIDSITRTVPFENAIGRYLPSVSAALGLLSPVAVWEQGEAGWVLQSGTSRENEVNAMMSAILVRGNVQARGNFDSLPVRFRAVATDLETRHAVVFSSGDLARAVRASMSIPVVFRPVRIDGRWLADGGLTDNLPVGTARALGADRVWMSVLPWAGLKAAEMEDPIALTTMLANSLFRQDTVSTQPNDVVIENETQRMVNLAFQRPVLDSLEEIGRRAARKAFAAAACVRPLGDARPRAVPAHVAVVDAVGIRTADVPAVLSDIAVAAGSAFDVAAVGHGLLEVGHDDSYRALWLSPTGRGDTVSFAPVLERAPDRAFGFGAAFDQFMGGRVWVGGIQRAVFGGDADAIGVTRLGLREQDFETFVRRRALVLERYVPFTLSVTGALENIRRFDGRNEIPSADTRETGIFAGAREDPAPRWQFEAGLDARFWHEPGRSSRGAYGGRLAAFRARGPGDEKGRVEAVVLNDWQRFLADLSGDARLLGIDWRTRVRLGWGNRLPLQQTFALGGDDGFAGYRLTEVRGSQEAFVSLIAQRDLIRSLRLRVELMAAEVGTGYGVFQRIPGTFSGRPLSGGRVGVEADTPLGPVVFAEGANADGLRTAFIRVGRWF